MTEVKISYEDGQAWLTVEESVSDETLIEGVKRAGRFSGTVVSREQINP